MEPIVIGLIVLTVFASIFTTLALIYLTIDLLKPILKPNAKRKSDKTSKPKIKKKSVCVEMIPCIFAFGLFALAFYLAAVVGVTFVTRHDIVEEKIDWIVTDANNLLASSKNALDSVSTDSFEAAITNMNDGLDYIPNSFDINRGFRPLLKKNGNYKELFDDSLNDMRTFDDWKSPSNTPSSCGSTSDVKRNSLTDQIKAVDKQRQKLYAVIIDSDAKSTPIKNQLEDQVENQKKLDVGKSKLVDHLSIMQKMVAHFKADVDKTEQTKKEWSAKMDAWSSGPDPQFILKLLIIVSGGIGSLLTIVGIIYVLRPRCMGIKWPYIFVSLSIYLTGLLIIITSVIVIVVGFGIVEAFYCPLKNKNFGLSNFTSPFETATTTFSICNASDSKVFAGLGSREIFTTENIEKNLQISEYKQAMLAILPNYNISAISIQPEFSQKLDVLETSLKKLDQLSECIDADNRETLENYRKTLRKIVDDSKVYISLIEAFNEKVPETGSIFKSAIDTAYTKTLEPFEKSLKEMRQQINTADFSCNSIIANYANTGHSICKKFDIPLDLYWICLICSLIGFLASIILQAFIYKDLKELCSNVKPSETGRSQLKPWGQYAKSVDHDQKKRDSGLKSKKLIEPNTSKESDFDRRMRERDERLANDPVYQAAMAPFREIWKNGGKKTKNKKKKRSRNKIEKVGQIIEKAIESIRSLRRREKTREETGPNDGVEEARERVESTQSSEIEEKTCEE